MTYTETEKRMLALVREVVCLEPYGDRDRPRVSRLCDDSIGRLFIAYWRDLERAPFAVPLPDDATDKQVSARWRSRLRSFSHVYNFQIVEVLDWFLRADDEDHPWLGSVDEHGRAKKLMKCHTMEALFDECQKCIARLPSPVTLPADHELGADDERVIMELAEGYTIVELLTPAALDVESVRMRHCIGHGGYDAKLTDRYGYHLYSVRGNDGHPVATIETTNRTIDGQLYHQVRQFVGPRNAIPEYNVVAAVNAAMPALRWLYPPRTKSQVDFLLDDVDPPAEL